MEIENNEQIFTDSTPNDKSKTFSIQKLEDIAIDTLSQQDKSSLNQLSIDNQGDKRASSENSTEPQNYVQCISLKNIKSKQQIEIESKQNQQILLNLNFNIDDLFKKISSLTEEINTDLQPRPLKQRQASFVTKQNKDEQKNQLSAWEKIQSTPLFEFKSSLTLTENKSEYQPIFFQQTQQKKQQFSISMKLFQTGKSLGCGKFGQVVQCRNIKTKGIFALKKIFKSVIDDYGMEDQLLTQLKILKQIDHPNIVKAYESFTDDYHIFILMQYVHGEMLVKKLKCSQNQCKVIIRQVLQALKYLHGKNIAHRDIKPENIIITADNVVKICDFGWAAQGQEPMNILCGTLDYISPQMAKEQPYTLKVDLWNLGVLAYQLIHGYPPFKASSKSRIFQRVKNLDFSFSDQIQISQQYKSFIKGFLRNQNQRQSLEWGLNHEFLKTASEYSKSESFNNQEFTIEINAILE